MKIGIFSDALASRHTGIGNYTWQIVSALEKKSDEHQIVLINSRANPETSLEQLTIPNPFPIFKMFSWYPYAMHILNGHEFDIIHNPSQVATYIRPKNTYVVTVHDLSPIVCPAGHVMSTRLDFSLLFPRTCKYSAQIIADSISTKNDLVRYFHIDPGKVRVVYLAADRDYRVLSALELDEARKLGWIPEKFILTVGTLEPRKNIPNLLIAYHHLLEAGFPHKLVIVGKKGWKYQKIFDLLDKLGLTGMVVFMEGLSVARLCELYNLADLFVYPSLYEGFGFPPLEAMSSGCPVITSDVSSLPEVVGDAGITINPHDTKNLSDQLMKVLTDENLRNEMRTRGIGQAGKFSWDTCISETLKVYEEALGK